MIPALPTCQTNLHMSDSAFIHTPDQLKELAADVLRYAKALGASEAAVEISEG